MGMLVAIIICGLALFIMFIIMGILIKKLGEAHKMNANVSVPITPTSLRNLTHGGAVLIVLRQKNETSIG